MKMLKSGSMFYMVMLTSVALLQLAKASCPPNRTACDEGTPCKAGWACLGPAGQQFCYRCRCNQLSECELHNGNVICNCENSNGNHGELCNCAPAVACDGVCLLNSVCDEFCDKFKTIDNLKLNLPTIDEHETSVDGCRTHCIGNDNCHIFTWKPSHCRLYGPPSSMPLSDILEQFEVDSTFELHIRKCYNCTESATEPMK